MSLNPLTASPPCPPDITGGSTFKIFDKAEGRSMEPGRTWLRILPTFPAYGLTRVANITGLDRIGIPVCMAVRPNSRGLSVAQGKGLDLASAKVSAAAESIECWHAERPLTPVVLERYDDLRQRVQFVADVTQLPRARNSTFANIRLPWTEAVDLVRQTPVWVPFELVHADATLPRMPGSGHFVFSTNGLASGNNPAEAILHALCELIERDAIALWKKASDENNAATRVDTATIDDPTCVTLIRRFEDAGILPMVWDTSSDIGVPVFRVLIFDKWSASSNTPFATAFGAGCHPSRTVALTRALTEAAQSRLTAIAGSRDDGTRERFQATQHHEAATYYAELAGQRGSKDFGKVSNSNAATIERDLTLVIDSLDRVGLSQVLVVDLTRPDSPLSVVRCIVPGLEGPSSSLSYVPGLRVRAALA